MNRLGIKRLLGHGAWTTLATVGAAAIGLLQVVVVTRFLGAQTYGQVALIMAVTVTIRQFVGVRVWEWAIREFSAAYVAKDVRKAGRVVRTGYALSIAVNVVTMVLVLGSSGFAAERFLHEPALGRMVSFYAVTLLFNWPSDTAYAVMRVAERFRFLSFQTVVLSLSRLVVIGGSVWLRPTLEVTLLAYVFVEFLAAVWMIASAHRTFKEDLGETWWQASTGQPLFLDRSMRNLLMVGGVTDTLKLIGGRADLLVLGWFASPSEVGMYRVASNFVEMFDRLASALSMIVFSDLAKLAAQRKRREYLSNLLRISALAAATVIPGTFLMWALSDWLISILYGERFMDASRLLRILAWSPLWIVGIWVQVSSVSIGRAHWGLQLVAVMVAIKLGLLAVLVPSKGAEGLALVNAAYGAIFALLVPLVYLRTRRHTRGWIPEAHLAAPREPTNIPT